MIAWLLAYQGCLPQEHKVEILNILLPSLKDTSGLIECKCISLGRGGEKAES